MFEISILDKTTWGLNESFSFKTIIALIWILLPLKGISPKIPALVMNNILTEMLWGV